MFGALCVGSLASAPARAEDTSPAPPASAPAPGGAAYFYPSSSWNIKPLEDSTTGLKICAISASFNNGFFIQMSAAQEGINSISINFRQPLFPAGTTANVGISAPGVIKKLLPSVMYKPELMVIDFKGQAELFEAIKTAGVMDFSLGAENQFRFYLSGFAVALPQLAQCMQNHASAGVALDIPVPGAAPVPASAPDGSSLPAEAASVPASAPQPEAIPAATYAAPAPAAAAPVAAEVAAPSPLPTPQAVQAPVSAPAPVPAPSAPAVSAPSAAASVENPLDSKGSADTMLRTGVVEQETGRAPPPPSRRLGEIEAPPVYTNTEPVISAPSPEALAKSKAAMERYQQEMSRVMPPKQPDAPLAPANVPAAVPQVPVAAEPYQAPMAGTMTPAEEDPDSAGVLKLGSQSERIGKKRLSDMLADDMARQYDEMSDDGRLRPDIKAQLDAQSAGQPAAETDGNAASAAAPEGTGLESQPRTYELKPLVVPLIKRGSAEEKALADILGSPAPATDDQAATKGAASQAPAYTPENAKAATPVISKTPPSAEIKTTASPSASVAKTGAKTEAKPELPPILKSGPSAVSASLPSEEALKPVLPAPAAPSVPKTNLKVTRETERIEVDLTGVNKPASPSDVLPPRQGKSWVDILEDKRASGETGDDAGSSGDDMNGVYVPPDRAAAPAFSAPSSARPVEVGKVPAVAPRTRARSSSAFSADASALTPEPLSADRSSLSSASALSSGASPRRSKADISVVSPDVQSLQQKVAALERENTELEAELSSALAQGKHETVSIENKNWNLERSTEMYNEAKKQMDRLGAQIQKERAQCAAEKKDLETMLFDPQLTQEEQLARLSELENAVNEADRKLEEQRQIYEGRIKLLQDQVGNR